MKKLPIILAFAVLTGCQTISFERGSGQTDTPLTQQQWHQGGGIFGLIEFSQPYDAKAKCGSSDWQSVTVNHSFVTALVSSAVPFGVYAPWAVGVNCK